MSYCPSLFHYERRKTREVSIGNTPLGGENPIRIQSMTNTSTLDTAGSVAQSKRITVAGADYVRLTAQGVREADNLANIRQALREDGYTVPLVADIHFNPRAADAAAPNVEKVRINPGNYVDPLKTFSHLEYTAEEYQRELQKIRERFVPFLKICRENGTAVRIGVNHGSLSDRILSRYGDTPAGMVESCLEFLRICLEEDFTNVVISMKASNVLIMVQSVRLLVQRMNAEGMNFPLHLGVTEAGDGEDGRVKSAVGIGALLIDGIGDTIRVSLSEDPELEIPVARKLVALLEKRVAGEKTDFQPAPGFDSFAYHRRPTLPVGPFGGAQVPQVVADLTGISQDFSRSAMKPDFVYVGSNPTVRTDGIPQLCDAEVFADQPDSYPVFAPRQLDAVATTPAPFAFLRLTPSELTPELLKQIEKVNSLVLLLHSEATNRVADLRKAFHMLLASTCRVPVVMALTSDATDGEENQLAAGMDFGPLLIDGFGDGILWSGAKEVVSPDDQVRLMFGVLQSSRLRMSKTEYISCPSCGRTLFDLQQVIARIKERTSHLKGLKIGIMGCIVNGPGEMADADYGYVGAGKGQVSLYKGQHCVEKSIPAEHALEKLIELIKANGDWKDPE